MVFTRCLMVAPLLCLFGCSDSPSLSPKTTSSGVFKVASTATSTNGVQRLVLNYNSLLSDGYKTINMTKLQEVATQELAEKAYYHMAAIGEGKSRMVSEMKKIDFVSTDFSTAAKCRIITKEIWDFAYADIVTGVRSNEVKDYQYDVRYELENRSGRWVIVDISATGEERKELPTWGKMFKKQP